MKQVSESPLFIEHAHQPCEKGLPSTERELAREALIGVTVGPEPGLRREWQILLVEDEAFVRKVTEEVLTSAGHRVIVAQNALEAVQACRGAPLPVHLLLTDIILPGKSGRDLARECRLLFPGIRVLLMSGYAEQSAWSESGRESDEYLGKPFSTHTLLRKVREVLEGTSADSREGG